MTSKRDRWAYEEADQVTSLCPAPAGLVAVYCIIKTGELERRPVLAISGHSLKHYHRKHASAPYELKDDPTQLASSFNAIVADGAHLVAATSLDDTSADEDGDGTFILLGYETGTPLDWTAEIEAWKLGVTQRRNWRENKLAKDSART